MRSAKSAEARCCPKTGKHAKNDSKKEAFAAPQPANSGPETAEEGEEFPLGPRHTNVTAMLDHVSAMQNGSASFRLPQTVLLQAFSDTLSSRRTTSRTPWCMAAKKNMTRNPTHSTRL
jgi:hypothetical protein